MNSILAPVKLSKPEIAAARAHEKATLARLPLQGNRKALQLQKQDREDGKARPVSEVSVRQQLTNMYQRARQYCGVEVMPEVKGYFEAAFTALDDETGRKDLGDLVLASLGDGNDAREAKATLARSIAENVGKLIRYSGSWSSQFYKQVTLAEDEIPYVRTFVPQEITVRMGTADGTMMTHDASPDIEDDTKVILTFLNSDTLRARLFDPYKGNIAESALGTVDIALDLMDKWDTLVQVPITVASSSTIFVSNFVNAGTAASHFHASQRIDVSNYPAGNLIAVTGNGASTTPRFACLQALDEYFGRLASALDGGVGPVRIRVASGMAHLFGTEFTPTSVANPYTDQLFANRKLLTYNGRLFEIIPDDTIPITGKYMYCSYGKPAGILFDKPAGSKVFRKEDDVLNEVTTWERGLFGIMTPIPWAIGTVALQFKS